VAPAATPAQIPNPNPLSTFFVNARIGSDTNDGSSPTPAPGNRGPFKTITRGIQASGAPGILLPAMIRIAGTYDPASTSYPQAPLHYDTALGEVFPLTVPPRILLQYDATNSDRDPSIPGATYRAFVNGGATPSPTIQFVATNGQNFTSEGGLDGSGGGAAGPSQGLVFRGGSSNVYLEASGTNSRLDIQLDRISCEGGFPPAFGGGGPNAVLAFVWNGASSAIAAAGSRFSTSLSSVPGSNVGVVELHAGCPPPATGTCTAGGVGTMMPTFSTSVITVGIDPGTGLPAEVEYGLFANAANAGSLLEATLDGVTVDGASVPPNTNPGILEGIYVRPELSGTVSVELVSGCRVTKCRAYGVQYEVGVAQTGGTGIISTKGGTIEKNGLAVPPMFAGTLFLPGSGILLNLWTGASVSGDIKGVLFDGNVIGLGVYTRSTIPPSLVVSGNEFVSQVYDPALAMACQDGTGAGLVISQTMGGVIDSNLVAEGNRFHGNEREAVLLMPGIVYGPAGGTMEPLFRNNRIWGNGTLFVPPPVPPPTPCLPVTSYGTAAAVRIDASLQGAGGMLAPILIHETIADNPGLGVWNVVPSASSVPQLWNSIVWGNNAMGGDLSGFDFVGATQGVVWFSDFCGAPHPPSPGGPCGSQSPSTGNNFCRSTTPGYLNPGAGDFELTCSGTNPCQSLCIDSAAESMDSNVPASLVPLFPTVDALNRLRVVDLNTPNPPPGTVDADMGALEKQTSLP